MTSNRQNPQSDLFADKEPSSMQVIELPDALLHYFPDFLEEDKTRFYFDCLGASLAWEQSTIRLYGKAVKIPRLNAWYGDKQHSYTYSGTRFIARPWTDELFAIKQKVEARCDQTFNSVLANLYRNGQDSVAWHSDDEPELGNNPVIASVSLGQPREFQLRHRKRKDLGTKKILLESGSLLLMLGKTQHLWQHQIAKTGKDCGERINLTFRKVM